jgi:Methyltransferase domain
MVSRAISRTKILSNVTYLKEVFAVRGVAVISRVGILPGVENSNYKSYHRGFTPLKQFTWYPEDEKIKTMAFARQNSLFRLWWYLLATSTSFGYFLSWNVATQASTTTMEGGRIPEVPQTNNVHRPSDKSSFALAYKQSLGFFDDIRDEDWKLAQKIHTKVFPNHFRETLDGYHDIELDYAPMWYAENFQAEFHCKWRRDETLEQLQAYK